MAVAVATHVAYMAVSRLFGYSRLNRGWQEPGVTRLAVPATKRAVTRHRFRGLVPGDRAPLFWCCYKTSVPGIGSGGQGAPFLVFWFRDVVPLLASRLRYGNGNFVVAPGSMLQSRCFYCITHFIATQSLSLLHERILYYRVDFSTA